MPGGARLAWEACQAPFSRGSPVSFQALKDRMKVSGEKDEQSPQSQRQTPTPAATMFQGQGPIGADGMPEPGLEPPLASSQKGDL